MNRLSFSCLGASMRSSIRRSTASRLPGAPGRSGRAGSLPVYSVRNRPRALEDRDHLVDEGARARTGSTGGMMLKPSAAPASNQSWIASATCSGVPVKVRWPRPPPSRPISWRTVSFSRRASVDDQRVAALRALDLVLVGQVGRQLLGRAAGPPADPQRLRQLQPRVLGPDQLVQLALQPQRLGLGRRRSPARCPGRILIVVRVAADARPSAPSGRGRTPARPSSVCCAVKTASAYRAARPLPSSDDPACTISGCPCGDRGRFSGPRTWKCRPTWSIGAHPVVVGPDAGRLVRDARVVLPAVPQLVGDLEELRGPLVPLARAPAGRRD